MRSDHTGLPPEEARRQLAASETRLASTADRTVHAIGTAVFGLSLGGYMAARNVVSGTGHLVLTLAFFALWVGGTVWIERAARTVPRRARLWSRLGIGGSLLVALVAVLPWLNLQAQTRPNTWPMVLAGAAVVAVPSLVAAAAIARSRA